MKQPRRNPVIQGESTGCGIASAAAIAGISYETAREAARSLGISAADRRLWSETEPVRRLLARYGYRTAPQPIPFRSWKALPNLALLATKWHRENHRPFWHWVVFVRDGAGASVLDSKKSLRHHRRTDFGRMKPKWYIEVAPVAELAIPEHDTTNVTKKKKREPGSVRAS